MFLFCFNFANVQNISYICRKFERIIIMNAHTCLLCIGSNIDRGPHMKAAREALTSAFPNIRWGIEMETEAIGSGFPSPFSNQVALFDTSLSAEEVRTILKQIERDNGRLPEDKAQGIVKLDIDLLKFDDYVLKPKDLEKDFVMEGIKFLTL